MNISPATYNPSVCMQAKTPKADRRAQSQEVYKAYPPAAIAAVNGVCWFGIGFAFDKLCKFLFKTNTTNKTSLIVNSAIGLVMGALTFAKAKQAQKAAQKV